MANASDYDDLVKSPPSTHLVGRRVVAFDAIDSTNKYALEQGGDGTVYVADRQTAGRGRLGRAWHSAPGLGLWFTVCLEGEDLGGLTFAAALALRDVLAGRCDPRVKWPNDVLVNGKKVSGILVERRRKRTALGIGLNVHHRPEDFPEEFREKAGSLDSEIGGEWNRAGVLRALLTHLDRSVMLLRSDGFEEIRSAWADALNLVGRRIRSGDRTGVVTALDGLGAIVLEVPGGGRHRIRNGEITLLDGE